MNNSEFNVDPKKVFRSTTFHHKYAFGDIVYVKTDPYQYPQIISGIQITADGGMLYKVSAGHEVNWAYEIELSDTRDESVKREYGDE